MKGRSFPNGKADPFFMTNLPLSKKKDLLKG